MTEPTPITTPSMARIERSLLTRSAESPTRTVSAISIRGYGGSRGIAVGTTLLNHSMDRFHHQCPVERARKRPARRKPKARVGFGRVPRVPDHVDIVTDDRNPVES